MTDFIITKKQIEFDFFSVNTIKQTEEMPVIRRADLENHNKDGGLWIVVSGKVYDVQEFR